MHHEKDIILERLSRVPDPGDRSIYRRNISTAGKYSYRLAYKYTDLYITSDAVISGKLREPLIRFYEQLKKVIRENKGFRESLYPLKTDRSWPAPVRDMCRSAALFGVGPMAAVAGAVCDSIAREVSDECSFLMIENGGDVYIKSANTVKASLFTGSRYFPEILGISIGSGSTPCGLCSSSGMMGHSLSLGKSDLVTVVSESAAMADAAATAIANAVSTKPDIDRTIKKYIRYSQVKGLIILKDDRLAIWGDLQLVK